MGFNGSPVVKPPRFQCNGGTSLIPGQGTKIRHASLCGQKKKKKEGGVYPTRNVRSFTYQLGLPTPCLSYWGRTVRKPSSVVGWWWSSPSWGTHQCLIPRCGAVRALQKPRWWHPRYPHCPPWLTKSESEIHCSGAHFLIQAPQLGWWGNLGEPHLCSTDAEPTILHSGQLVPKSI